ncbi:pleckstrin homology domain-containing family A member 7-like isoform X2 [Watersipora subatra]|uniref:pleckstrin homology domain-containing family A member 7-like isoform X2 n=1 Tax=Watersipora subatra TaxID=2589382 RepID=UPI00355B5399
MAADVYGVLLNTDLGYGWDRAATSDGRVFFINDYDEITTWINPVTGEPVQSGHATSLGLPRGWELGYTPEGIRYYIDHNNRQTTFVNPRSGVAEAHKAERPTQGMALTQANRSLDQLNCSMPDSPGQFHHPYSSSTDGLDAQPDLQRSLTHLAPPRQQGRQGHGFQGRQIKEPVDTAVAYNATPYTARLGSPANPKFLTNSPITNKSKSARSLSHSPSKRGSMKRQSSTKKMNGPQVRERPQNLPVSMRGWLHKFESGPAGVRTWRRRYFVLSEFCLYTYKDEKEVEILDSIILPSYKVSAENRYKKELGFKVTHENMKTQYFAAPDRESMNNWMAALQLATAMQKDSRDKSGTLESNRTEGDGTDSPGVASPFYDQRSGNRFSAPPHSSVASPMRSSQNRPQSYNVVRGNDPRSPEAEDHWAGPSSAPYEADWQVREPYDERDNSYIASRSYTPPVPQYNDYEYQSGPGQLPPSSHKASNYDYEHYNNSYYPQPQSMSEQRNSQLQAGHRPAYPMMNDYGVDATPPQHALNREDREPARDYSALMPGYEHSLSYRDRSSNSAAYTSGYSAEQPLHGDTYQQYEGANGVSVRGEPRTPPSVVSPPWRRDNPHTPTYRPPHYENISSNIEHRHTAPPLDDLDRITPPPRPEKFVPKQSNIDMGSAESDITEPRRVPESVGQSHSFALDPQKWRDELQARTNTSKRVDDPLIFQFPVPYRQPDWLQTSQAGHQSVRGPFPAKGHQPINYRPNQTPMMSTNNSNNNVKVNGHDVSHANNTGVPAFKPPPVVVTHSRPTSNDLVGKTSEELVLLLIELRREQTQFESSIAEASRKLRQAKAEVDRLQARRENSYSIQRDMQALQEYITSNEKQIEMHRPLIQLVDNMVKMSSTPGEGNAERPLRQMERREIPVATRDDLPKVNTSQLDKKLESLYRSEQNIEKHSMTIAQLKDRMRGIEDELLKVTNLLEHGNNYPLHVTNRMLDDKRRMEFDLSQIRRQLSAEFRQMDVMTTQNTKLQEEVMAIKSQLVGEPARVRNTGHNESLQTLQQKVQQSQQTASELQKQKEVLSDAMAGVRLDRAPPRSSTYFETDVDTMASRDLSGTQPNNVRRPDSLGLSQPATSLNNSLAAGMSKPKPTTMRDMKRASAFRQEHQRPPERAPERAPERPFNQQLIKPPPPAYATVQKTQQTSAKPRPVSAYEPRGDDIYSQIIKKPANRSASVEKPADVLPSASLTNTTSSQPPAVASVAPWDRPQGSRPAAMRARRKENRARYITISSSQPVQLESGNGQNGANKTVQSARSSTALNFGWESIDNELTAPEKVHIPERYVPDSSDEEEVLSPTEMQKRAEKAEQIRKMVATQSLQEFSQTEIVDSGQMIDMQKVNEERKRREVVLEMRHAVAKEVTKKMQRMRSKSHENLSGPTETY